MVKKTERQNAVANYLLDNPQASPAEISEALSLTNRAARYIISVMIANDMIMRRKNDVDGHGYKYVLSEWYAIKLNRDPVPATPEERHR